MNKITIFGNSETCSPCQQLKKFLYEIGEEEYEFKDFAEKDILKVREYKKELFPHFAKGEVVSIPTIFINDNPKLVGFNEEIKSKILQYLEK